MQCPPYLERGQEHRLEFPGARGTKSGGGSEEAGVGPSVSCDGKNLDLSRPTPSPCTPAAPPDPSISVQHTNDESRCRMQDVLHPAFTKELIVGVHTPTAAAIVGKSTPGCMVKTCLCLHCSMTGHEIFECPSLFSGGGGRGAQNPCVCCVYMCLCVI